MRRLRNPALRNLLKPAPTTPDVGIVHVDLATQPDQTAISVVVASEDSDVPGNTRVAPNWSIQGMAMEVAREAAQRGYSISEWIGDLRRDRERDIGDSAPAQAAEQIPPSADAMLEALVPTTRRERLRQSPALLEYKRSLVLKAEKERLAQEEARRRQEELVELARAQARAAAEERERERVARREAEERERQERLRNRFPSARDAAAAGNVEPPHTRSMVIPERGEPRIDRATGEAIPRIVMRSPERTLDEHLAFALQDAQRRMRNMYEWEWERESSVEGQYRHIFVTPTTHYRILSRVNTNRTYAQFWITDDGLVPANADPADSNAPAETPPTEHHSDDDLSGPQTF